jgi:Zn-dependent protease/predicted transcriptional regulator
VEATIKLGRVWGIPIGLHSSWFLIFALVTWSLAAGYLPIEYPSMPSAALWLMGAVTSILFFASVLLHELGHTYLALRNKIPVRGITLFLFGGVAQITRDPDNAGAEFRIAIAGPATSLLLGVFFGGVWLSSETFPYLAAPSLWLARINLSLALFNLIPGFPLDGGRVLRALVWQVTGNFHRATQTAAFAGQLVAFGFIGVGVLVLLDGNLFNGLWLIFIGWFLQNAAASSYAQSSIQKSMRSVRVGQIMQRDCSWVPGSTSLQRLVEDEILATGRRCFLVADDGRLRGVLTLRDIASVPRGEWDRIPAEKAMVPWERLRKVDSNTELLTALQTMDDANIAQLPVVEGDRILGMLSREQILAYLRTRAELGM